MSLLTLSKRISNNKKTNITPNKHQQDMFERISKEILEYNEVNDFDFDHLITCNYYDTEEFVKCEFKASNSFSMHLNIHSIPFYTSLEYSFYPITY